MNLFYSETDHITYNEVRLTGQEAQHASKVLRLEAGDDIHVTDGKGTLYLCRINRSGRNEIIADILGREAVQAGKIEAILCIGMIKKRDRLEFAIEKAVELGAGKIILYRADHSEKTGIRLNRFEQIVIRAMKQSLRCYLPEVMAYESLDDVIKEHAEAGKFVADETKGEEECPFPEIKSSRVLLIVGPEGGFSARERELMEKTGCKAVSLGNYRLRTETAAITILNYFRYRPGR